MRLSFNDKVTIINTSSLQSTEKHPTIKTRIQKKESLEKLTDTKLDNIEQASKQISATPPAKEQKLTNNVTRVPEGPRRVKILKGQSQPAKATSPSAWGSVKTTVSAKAKGVSNQILKLASHRENKPADDQYRVVDQLTAPRLQEAAAPQTPPAPLNVNRSITHTPQATSKLPAVLSASQEAPKPDRVITIKDKKDKETTAQEELQALYTPSAGAILINQDQIKQRASILKEIFQTEIIFHNQVQEMSQGLNFLNSDAIQKQLTSQEKVEVKKLSQLAVYLKDNKHIVENMSQKMEDILKNNAGNLEQTTKEFAQLFSSDEMAAYLTVANNTATFYQGVAGKELAYSNLIDKYGKDNPEILKIGLQGQHIQLISLVQRPLKFDLFVRDLMKTVPEAETSSSDLAVAKEFIAKRSDRSNKATAYTSQPEIKKFETTLQDVAHSQTFKNLTALSQKVTNLAQQKTLTSSEKETMAKFNLISRYLNADQITPDLQNELKQLKGINSKRLDEIRSLQQHLKGAEALQAQDTPIDSVVKSGVDTVKRLYQESGVEDTLALFR